MADKPYLEFFENIEQLDIFARGLWHLAGVDGVADEELDVIRSFLDEMGEPGLMDTLDKVAFDAKMAALTLKTEHQRTMFLKTAITLVRADGEISDKERMALAEIAREFGMLDRMPALSLETAEFKI